MDYRILLPVILVTNSIEVMTGFGSTIIAVAVCASFIPLDFLIPVLIPVNIMLSAYIVIRHWQYIDGVLLLRTVLPLVGAGTVLGVLLFSYLPNENLKFIFGLCVALFSTYELVLILRQSGENASITAPGRRQTALWLLGGGIMQGMYASGGPMVVYLVSRRGLSKETFRATLSMLWLVVNIFISLSHFVNDRLSWEILSFSALLLPSVIAGIYLGEFLHSRIADRYFNIIVYSLLLVAGLFLVFGS